jgi:hypothetical protein
MCRRNFFLLGLYIAVSIFAGVLLASYIIKVLGIVEFLPAFILTLVCVFIFALFLLPGLNHLVE